jgi:hypothetical protein
MNVLFAPPRSPYFCDRRCFYDRRSGGRALHSHCRGRRFEPDQVHFIPLSCGNFVLNKSATVMTSLRPPRL